MHDGGPRHERGPDNAAAEVRRHPGRLRRPSVRTWTRLGRWLLALGLMTALSPAAYPQQGANRPLSSDRFPADEIDRPAPRRPQEPERPPNAGNRSSSGLPGGMDVDQMLSPEGLTSTLKVMLLLTVLSLAPSILIMTTSFIRFVIVFGLLRQALGTQTLPPNQVLISLCLFMTFAIMAPVWQEAYQKGIRPYTHPEPGRQRPTLETAFHNTVRPLRRFMSDQIERTGNSDAVWLFLRYQQPDPDSDAAENYREPDTYEELPLSVLLPAYVVSELKTAFVIGFQIYLPFLIIDMVVSSILISMGMLMLPPVLISLPFKLLLFVLIDGWYLTVGMLMQSVQPFG